MATPKPGEIRCPTCHRSTPPATFCTQCGSAIPPDARVRPRGLDREELQDRIRARRSGADPYRRGAGPDDTLGGYERFEPEPEDRVARRSEATGVARRDLLRDTPPPPSRPLPTPVALTPEPDAETYAARDAAPHAATEPDPYAGREGTAAWQTHAPEPQAYPPIDPHPLPEYEPARYGGTEGEGADRGYLEYDDAYAPEYEEWEERRERPSVGAGVLGVIGFLALGVLALVAGAFIAGLFGNRGVGQSDPTPSPSLSVAPAASASEGAPTPEPTESTPPVTSGAPASSGDPVTFPDGFTADVQPCLPGTADIDGCDSNGASNGGSVVIWVGFTNGAENDVLSAQVFNPDGGLEGTGTIDLERLGCRGTCHGGWTYFPFDGLEPGDYEVRVLRNGDPAGETAFEVS